MNEIEQLEKELKALCPKEPSADFERRVEDALGDSGWLALRQLPDGGDQVTVSPIGSNLFFFPGLFMIGAAALVALFLFFPSLESENVPAMPMDAVDPVAPVLAQDSQLIANDSPINGVSSEELSAMSEPGWEEPQAHEILINFSDEGIVDRPGMSPARRYRYHFLDETIWRNPETNTFIRSSVPRQETILIGLEPF
tara:strand:- start:110 stop:700 length:591 start_codon:yes stop_codon:yes gene_type:complete